MGIRKNIKISPNTLSHRFGRELSRGSLLLIIGAIKFMLVHKIE